MKAGLRKTIGALGWTAVLAGLVATVDFWVAGRRVPVGWQRVARIADIPAPPGPIYSPSYLSPELAWPPAQAWLREDEPGWWLRLDGADGRPAAWLGSSVGAPPKQMGAAAGCLAKPIACPEGWQRMTLRRDEAPAVHIVSSLEHAEILRMRRTLRRR